MAHNWAPSTEVGPPSDRPLAVPLPPHEIIDCEGTLHGIAYDLDIHHIEDNLPGGWAKRRGAYTWHIGHAHVDAFSSNRIS
jgi:hypothetical protein